MADTIAGKIIDFARENQMKTVGSGECFDLADQAIKKAGGKSADAYGTVAPDADYVWGEAIVLTAIAAGDILQYRDYKATRSVESEITLKFSETDVITYGGEFENSTAEHAHHTAIVTTSLNSGQATVVEQNVERKTTTKERTVDFAQRYLQSQAETSTTTAIKVTIDTSWATKVKAQYDDAAFRASIDGLLKKYNGQTFDANVTAKSKVEVTGTIKAYRVK